MFLPLLNKSQVSPHQEVYHSNHPETNDKSLQMGSRVAHPVKALVRVQDALYSLDVAGSSPGYSTADRGRELPGGGAQLAERRPGEGGLGQGVLGSPRTSDPCSLACKLPRAALSSDAVAMRLLHGEDYVVCGDEKGDLWTYEVSQCLRAGAKTDKMIPPTQILEWPAPKRKGHGPIVGTSVNSVAMDPELQYLVALTDKNIAAVWRRA
ncbi:UNVERIFIED_CONTAM: hypothetical protein FKN15_032724 [Acipenser sinensis]